MSDVPFSSPFICDCGAFVNHGPASKVANCPICRRQWNTDTRTVVPEFVVPPPAGDDSVNHPPHYTAGKIECIAALEAATIGLEGIEAVCTAAAIKYLWRWKKKGGVEDLKKARWYIERLIGDGK